MGGVGFFIAVVIGVLLIWVVGYEIVYKKVGGGASEATKSFTECNSELRKCACFFTTHRCPSDATLPIGTKKTDNCPADYRTCNPSDFAEIMKDKPEGEEGTCCVLDPDKPISPSLLNQPEQTGEEGEGAGGGAGDDMDCDRIDTCSDYQKYPGYSDRLCRDDPCRDKRDDSDAPCFPSSAGTCSVCEKDCRMGFYNQFSADVAKLKQENLCNCAGVEDVRNQAELACIGKSEGDGCGDPGTGERCGMIDGVLTCMSGCNYQGSIPGGGALGYECLAECACDTHFSPMRGEGFGCSSSFFDMPQTCCVKAPPPNCCVITECEDYSINYYGNPEYCTYDACGIGDCVPTFYEQPDEFYADRINPRLVGKYNVCLDCSELEDPVDDCSDYNDFTGSNDDPEARERNQRICMENPCGEAAGKCVPGHDGGVFDDCEDCPESCDIDEFYSDTQSVEDPGLLEELKERNPCGCT